jgi:hypothetical protein
MKRRHGGHKSSPALHPLLDAARPQIVQVYQYLDGTTRSAFQFSVTEHMRKLDPRSASFDAATGLLPGVFFNYELSPIRVRIQEERKSFGHFLTSVFAIIGGVFVVMGMIDSLLHKTLEGVARAARRKGGSGGGLMQ